MKRLKELRQSANYTQEQLAEMLKTTQQTIARWEAGKTEPGLSALRDIARIFGTSVDDLLGVNPLSSKPTSAHFFVHNEAMEYFWGHVGIMLPGAALSQWYPITVEEAGRIARTMQGIEPDSPWFTITTLNNRMLIINGLAVKHIQLLDDNADEVEGDWELGWDSYQGYSPEIYRALADWFEGPDENYSEDFKQVIEAIIAEEKLDDRALPG